MHPAIIMVVVFVIGFIAGIKFAYFTVNKAEQIREEDVEEIKYEARNAKPETSTNDQNSNDRDKKKGDSKNQSTKCESDAIEKLVESLNRDRTDSERVKIVTAKDLERKE